MCNFILGADQCSECNKPNANVTGTPTGIAHSHGDPECIQSISGRESSLSTRLQQCGSMRKSPMACFDPRKYVSQSSYFRIIAYNSENLFTFYSCTECC